MKNLIRFSILMFSVLLIVSSCKNAEDIKKRELAKKKAYSSAQIIKAVKPDNLGEINKTKVDEFEKIIQNKNVQLVDVRTPKEYTEGHIKNFVNIDFKKRTFPDYINVIDKEKPVAIYCRSANRSGKAALIMQALGFKKIYELDGGIKAWKAENKELSIKNKLTDKKIQNALKEKKFKANNIVGKNHQAGVLDFENLIKSNKVTLVDVRTPREFKEGHIKGAINIDWKNRHFANNIIETVSNNKPVAVYCHSGNRATRAMFAMDALGFTEIYNLEYGIKSWKAENKPLITLEIKGDKHHLDVKNFNNAILANVGTLIDIRTPKEYEEYHIPGAINIDYKNDNFKNEFAKLNKDMPVLIYCRSGGRSERATKMLDKLGYKVYNLDKGILKWKDKGMKIVGKNTKAHDTGEEGC